MKSRFLVLFLALLLVFGLVPVVGAQGDTCYGLSADDCAILQAAEAKSGEITSFNLNYNFNLNANVSSLAAMGLMADPSEGILEVSSSGGGPIAWNPNAENPMDALQLALDVTASVLGGGTDESVDLSFVIVDGNFYIKDPDTGNWSGSSLETLAQSGGLPFDLTAMLEGGGDPSAMLEGAPGMGDMGDMDMSAYIVQNRLADDNLMGQTMYPFQTTVDVGAFLNSPEFQNIMNSAMQSAAGTNPNVGMAAAMLPMVLAGSQATITVTQWVGAEDGYIHRMALLMNASVDLNALVSAAGGGSDAPQLDPITVMLDLTVDLADINVPVTVTAPEGVTVR